MDSQNKRALVRSTLRSHPHSNRTRRIFHRSASNTRKMDYEQRMKAAIASLESQEVPNYSEAARQFNLDRTAIKNQLLGKTTSRAEANSRCQQLLTNAQEEQLIVQINKVMVHHMPLTS